MTSDETPQMQAVLVNLDVPRARLHKQLQRTIDLVSFGLIAAPQAVRPPVVEGIPSHVLRPPNSFLHITMAEEQALDFEAAQGAFPTWILGFGLREIVEATEEFLEEARVVCAALSFGSSPVAKDIFEAGVSREGKDGRTFRQANFPDKMALLRRRFGVTSPVEADMLSVNRARACLVHRRGIVTPVDCNEGNALTVRWRRLEFLLRDSKGERPIREPMTTPAEEAAEVLMRVAAAEHTFQVGAVVTFTLQDFSDLCHATGTFAYEILGSVGDYGARMGVKRQEAIGAPPTTEQGEA